MANNGEAVALISHLNNKIFIKNKKNYGDEQNVHVRKR